MSETGYICPKCGNMERFYADLVVATFYGCWIDPDGWDYFGSEGNVELTEDTTMTCQECGYEGNVGEFEEIFKEV